MDSTEIFKNKIGERLVRKLAEALKAGDINEEEVPIISAYILDKISKATTSSELIDFLEDISQKWSIFSQVLTMEKSDIAEGNKEEKIEQINSLIEKNNIDEALKVAIEANNQITGGNN